MKKLVFISFAVLGLGMFPKEAWSLPPNPLDPGSSQSNPNFVPLSEEQFNEYMRNQDRHGDDIRNLMEMFNNQFTNMNSQISGLTQQIRDQNDRISDLTNQNNDLQAQNNSLNQRLTDILNSIEQQKLDEAKKANDLKEKELAQKKAAEEAAARRERDKVSRNNQRNDQLRNLEKERDRWSSYIDGRKKDPAKWDSFFGRWENQKESADFNEKKRRAPEKIREIEQKMANVRASFE